MQVFDMVAVIVVFSVTAGVINNLIKSRAKNTEVSIDDDTAERIDGLEERIKVLERVITDDRHSLKREIDGLGD